MMTGLLKSMGLTREEEYHKWSSSLEKKLQYLLTLLKSMRGKNECKAAAQTLSELWPYLQIHAFDMLANDPSFNLARGLLLDLWHHVLMNVDSVPAADSQIFMKAIVALIRRGEFDMSYMCIDVHDKPHCSHQDLVIAQRYRLLLYNTQGYVAAKLSDKDLPLQSAVFCARVLAVTYFRVPGVRQQMVNTVLLEETHNEALIARAAELRLPAFLSDAAKAAGSPAPPHKQANGTSSAPPLPASPSPASSGLAAQQASDAARDASQSSVYPKLFQWARYHAVLLASRIDNEDDRLRQAPREWPSQLVTRDGVFEVFLREWLEYVRTAVPDDMLSWPAIPGYTVFQRAFLLHLMKNTAGFSKALQDLTKTFLLIDSTLVNSYMRITFSRTSVYEIFAMIDALSSLEGWMKELQEHKRPLPPQFDCEYFSTAFDVILDAEHHQIISRVLTLFYSYSDLFLGDVRRRLFGDFLLKKHFFRLFLHWDYNVRNIFQQLLIFKMVRIKRSRLQGEGFVVGELGAEGNRFSKPIHTNDQLLSPIALDNHEFSIDFVLFGKIETYVQMVSDQVHHNSAYYPKEWEVYVPRALSEYKNYLSRYYQWEAEGGEQPLRPVPLKIRNDPVSITTFKIDYL